MLMALQPPVQVLTASLPPALATMVKLALAPPALAHMAKPPLELIRNPPTLPPDPTRTPLGTMVLLIITPQHPMVLMVKVVDTVNTLTPALNLQATSWPLRLSK